ncbi:MAG: hypothetical protein ACI4PF_03390 [Christensenellales bacterium]
METDNVMTLQDFPVSTRNYTIVDNITGKPVDQSNYTLKIDPEVIKKLNKLKQVNEEKIKQATLREQYGNETLVSTFTPADNTVFTPLYKEEYIDYQDYNTYKPEQSTSNLYEDSPTNTYNIGNQPTSAGAEVIMSDTLLDRVVVRTQNTQNEQETNTMEQNKPDYISTTNTTMPESQNDYSTKIDNSVFTPETMQQPSEQQTSEQPITIQQPTPNKNDDKKRERKTKKNSGYIDLDESEIASGRKIAWLAYLLFFIPLLFKRKNRFVRIHANEGLELNLMEILGGILIAQYFLLPNWVEIVGVVATISMIGAILGAVLVGACALTIIPMMISALCGKQFQTPWLWKKRMIYVPTERTI